MYTNQRGVGEGLQMQTVSYSGVVTKLFASVAAAIRLTNHARKMDGFAGRGGLGVGA